MKVTGEVSPVMSQLFLARFILYNFFFRSIFRPVISKIMEVFQPGAVVLQCGADSLSGKFRAKTYRK